MPSFRETPRPPDAPRIRAEWLDDPEYELLFDRITRALERLSPLVAPTTSAGVRREAAEALARVLARYDVSDPLARLIRDAIARTR